MEALQLEGLVLAVSVLLLALLLAGPLLFVFLVVRNLRKGIAADRQAFEDEIRSKLEEMTESHSELRRRLDESAENTPG